MSKDLTQISKHPFDYQTVLLTRRQQKKIAMGLGKRGLDSLCIEEAGIRNIKMARNSI